MLFNSEICFIDEFIANLKLKGIKEIPFDNPEFYNGVGKMSKYFQANRNLLGEVSNEISLLFIKNPFEDIYKRFRDAISLENGGYLSFVNPDYITGVLELSIDDASYIILKNRSGVPADFIKNCAESFCSGANIEV